MEPDLDLIACVRQALIDSDHKPGDGPDTLARKLVLGLRPTVLQLPTSNPSMLKFAITQARSASVLTCLLTGDENLEVHTGPDGIQHTPLRIGDFANAISRAEPGAKLHSIANIKFTRVVHLGDTVIITLTRMWERMGFVMYKVEGHVGSEPICEPTEVVVARAK